MKVYLDDERNTPEGWVRTYTVEETIEHLKTRSVTDLSLDNDLGIGLKEGFMVLDWLEDIIYNDSTFPLPDIFIHSANSSRVRYMQQTRDAIKRIRHRQFGGV